jgi:hypothetical protein
MDTKLDLIALETNKGYYFTINTKNYSASNLGRLFYDGENPKKTFHSDWFFVDHVPSKVEENVKLPDTNYRYELIDPSIQSPKFPLFFLRDDVAYHDTDEYRWVWKTEFSHLQSLYVLKFDEGERIKQDVHFEFCVSMKMNIDEISSPKTFFYPLSRGEFPVLTNKDVEHQLIDKIMFPTIIIHETPSRLSSRQVYSILREYIKRNINPAVARITSDYDFCFAVDKIIALAEPYDKEHEILNRNNKSYHPKRFDRRHVSSRSVRVFEMTHSPENYKGYTPILDIIANSESELADKIDELCKNTAAMINEPLVDCPHCRGMGVVLKDQLIK